MTLHIAKLSAAAALAALLPLCGCQKKAPLQTYLAKVGPAEISTNDFIYEAQWRARANRLVFSKELLLDELVTREALVEKAKELGLDKDRDFVRSCESLLIATLKEREIDPKIKAVAVTDADVQVRYVADVKQYSHPAKVQLAIVFVPLAPGADEGEARARLAKAQQLARALPPDVHGFGNVAADYSEDQGTRYKGGDIGWFDEGQERYRWPSEIVTAGAALQKGQISDIIATARGLFLVKKLDTRPPTVAPLAEVSEPIRRRLLAEKQKQIERDYVKSLERSLGVTINTQALAAMQAPPAMAKHANTAPPSLPR